MTRNGGRILVDSLVAHGVEVAFCVPGESYLPVLDAFHDAPIRMVVAKHEAGAANMAEAAGKLTGRPGVAFATRAPGATHASTGVFTAFQDSTPLVLFVGQVPLADRGREALQELDYERFFGGLAKWVAEARDPAELPELTARAFSIAASGRPGPVVVSLPEDVLYATAEAADVEPQPVERAAPAAADLARLRSCSRAPSARSSPSAAAAGRRRRGATCWRGPRRPRSLWPSRSGARTTSTTARPRTSAR